ncbi:MAG: CNNM domain-containing protein [Planctomycetales bacterium]
MPTIVAAFLALALFAVGLRLSAFFSGNETGFYRVSFLRLSIDAQAGDPTARRLQWFVRNPAFFVATTLVGNNVANYTATLAIGIATAMFLVEGSGWIEILVTLAVSPVIFVFGELVPKNLYYQAPMHFLRRDSRWFVLFYYAFAPFSFPLMLIAKLFERLAGGSERQLETVFGRTRLVQVLSEGRREGILTDVQNRLVHGLLFTAAQPVTDAMIPADRVLGVSDDRPRGEILDYARRFGTSNVPLHRAGNPRDWHGYVRVVDAAVSRRPIAQLVRPMPRIEATATKLETLLALRQSGAAFGVVRRNGRALGVVSEHGLVEQLFRPPQIVAAGPLAISRGDE